MSEDNNIEDLSKARRERLAMTDLSGMQLLIDAERRAAEKRRANNKAMIDDGSQLPAYCDEALTLDFTTHHADDIRYCETHGTWYTWDGSRWDRDTKRTVIAHARDLCRAKAATILATVPGKGAIKAASSVASARTVTAIVNLARAAPTLATAATQWDADPWSLNTPAGTVNLRTGEMHPHDRAALCSKRTAVAPADTSDCPRWRAFVAQITNDDQQFARFLQRAAGYCLTGITREHVLFFLYGTGANGKGTFLNTLTAIFADYAAVSSMETFTSSQNDRHPTDLAMLQGSRLVAAQETEEGRRWAESRIKSITGGDPVTARFMRQDFFTFAPQFKLVIAGNHKPGLRNIDEAIRRRFHLLPFIVSIPPLQRDPKLFDKLKEEWPAILRWAIEGCLEWQANGLNPPAAVLTATTTYFEDEDAFGQWLADAIVPDEGGFESSADLFANWKSWAEKAGLRPGSQKSFTPALEARGYVYVRTKKTRGFQGIRINRRDYTDDPRYGG